MKSDSYLYNEENGNILINTGLMDLMCNDIYIACKYNKGKVRKHNC